jgi:peroxiredoxin family protein
MSQPPRFIIFAHHSTYDALHQVATLGLTAAAMGKHVTVVLMFWAIKKLAEGRLDELDFPPEHQREGKEVAQRLKDKNVPTISQMFAEAKQVGHFRLVACSAGLEYMGVDPVAVEKQVDEVMGLPAILRLTAGAETTLFI